LEVKVRKNGTREYEAGYRWLSDGVWQMVDSTTSNIYNIPVRDAPSISGHLQLAADLWQAAV